MNLIFAASLWSSHEAEIPAWRDELSALARRNALFLWDDLSQDLEDDEIVPIPPEILPFFTGHPIISSLNQGLKGAVEAWGLTLDETALVADSRDGRASAREASLPCFYLSRESDAPEGGENVFASIDEVVNAVWKVNTVERHLFPIVTVGGLLFDAAGNVLLVRTRKWSGKWGIPGGKVDYGETLEQAFRREIREETGLELREARLVLTQEAVEHPEFFRKRHFVLVNFFGRVAGTRPAIRLNHEGADYFWGPLDDVLDDAERPLNGPTRVLAARAQEEKRQGGAPWAS
jgi:ADP-ribose pyrophosphatase YjhB (NUDIX family)